MDLIYLDYNCFQRRFDDPNQIRIQIEALACQEIFNRAEAWHGSYSPLFGINQPKLN